MTTIEAWNYIINNWYCYEWQAIPQTVQNVLNLDSRLGMCGGMLVTKKSAQGTLEFVQNMNRKLAKLAG